MKKITKNSQVKEMTALLKWMNDERLVSHGFNNVQLSFMDLITPSFFFSSKPIVGLCGEEMDKDWFGLLLEPKAWLEDGVSYLSMMST